MADVGEEELPKADQDVSAADWLRSKVGFRALGSRPKANYDCAPKHSVFFMPGV